MCTDDDDDDDIDDDKGFVVGLINHCIALHWGCALMTMMMTRALGLLINRPLHCTVHWGCALMMTMEMKLIMTMASPWC